MILFINILPLISKFERDGFKKMIFVPIYVQIKIQKYASIYTVD